MRRVLIILFLFSGVSVHAQFTDPPIGIFTLQPRVGMSIEKYIVGGIDIGFEFHHFDYAVTMIMDRYEAAYFGFRAGYPINIGTNIRVMPLISPAYKYTSADKTEYTLGKNYWVWDYGLRLQKSIYFIQADYIEEEFNFTIGATIR